MTVDADAGATPSAELPADAAGPPLPDGFDPADIGRAHRATEPLHSQIYFAQDAAEVLVSTGLRPGRMPYFASRSAAMGAVGPGVVTATFYNFNAELVARSVPRAWTLASPEQVLEARLRAADTSLRRLLGEDVLGSAEVAELAELTREASAGCAPEGRPLYAAHADLAWPDAPHLVLWHAVTLLREHRGDGHLAALLDAGLSGLEAIVTHSATGRGFREDAAKLLRGWSDEQWAAAQEGLRRRGILDDDGALTPAGEAQRTGIEARTDALAAAPWVHLGAQGTARVIALGRPLTRAVAATGVFPDTVFASPRA